MVSTAGVAACLAAVAGCATVARAADDDWEYYRHDVSRSGEQRHFSDLGACPRNSGNWWRCVRESDSACS
jgi:hypothetical protein